MLTLTFNNLPFLFTYFQQAHNTSTCIYMCVCTRVYEMIKRVRSPLSEGLRYGPQRTRRIKTTFTLASRLRHRDTNTSEQDFEV